MQSRLFGVCRTLEVERPRVKGWFDTDGQFP